MALFLLIGQSNMEGEAKPEPQDLAENPGVYVLGFDTCGDRQWNQWSLAKPPLHRCWAGVGPGDSFAKVMADAMPRTTVGLIPNALSGVDIDFFRKGVVSKRRNEFEIPPDNSRQGAYDMVVERARLAQNSGTIRGILFHQGESDTGQAEWVDKVAEMVRDLRADLNLPESVPFLAGELPYGGCCASHNTYVHRLPNVIPNAHVVSAVGLQLMDQFHFDLAGQRAMGERYAVKMRELLGL